MASQVDATEYLHLLDCSDISAADEVKELIIDNLRNNKESWLLNSVVDFFLVSHSKRCLDILQTVREPHDKQLFDRLADCIKGQHKLSALAIIGHLVNKQIPWLHKITSHPLFNHLLKLLKTDVDVPILVSGVLTLTSLLPVVPVLIQPHMQDILEIFSRLAAFNLSKSVNIPNVYLMHLNVAIYCLFHRMYSMFPCHLLTHLRSHYSKKENQDVFQNTVAPMLERIKMHPLLVTSCKEKEVSKERWRQKEVHDIIVECAQLSLDTIEGFQERVNYPPPYLSMNSQEDKEMGRTQIENYPLENFPFKQNTSTSAIDMSSLWSPSSLCGLSTPPPGAPTSTTNVLERSDSAQQSAQLSVPRNTPQVHDSPLPSQEPLTPIPTTEVQQNVTSQLPTTPITTAGHQAPSKRLSAMSLSLAGKVLSTPNAAEVIPPSPLKCEFSSEPPLHAQKMQAIRKLSFQGTQSLEDCSEQHTSEASVPVCVPKRRVLEISSTIDNPDDHKPVVVDTPDPLSPSVSRKPPSLKQIGTADTFDFGTVEDFRASAGISEDQIAQEMSEKSKQGELSQSVPSVTQLPDIIDSLHHGNFGEMNDEEVQELTGSRDMLDKDDSNSEDSQSIIGSALTAQSVQAFKKSVNRIRFNSMNVTKMKEVITESEPVARRTRSRSCPDLDPDLTKSENLFRQRSNSGTSGSSMSEYITMSQATALTPSKNSSGVSFSAEPIAEEEEVDVKVEAISDEKVEADKQQQHKENFMAMFPYHQLFPMSLPCGPFMKCYNCMRSEGGTGRDLTDYNIPLFSTYSPPDLLDRHLMLSSDLHSMQVESEKVKGTSFLQFGGAIAYPKGLPATDEIKLLKGEIQLLHNQMMYERQKRELYAKRNRRLLGRIAKATALEEQNSAMQDQLRLQENEIQNLQVTVRLQQQECQELKTLKDKIERERQDIQKANRQDIQKLIDDKGDLQNILDSKLKENNDVKRDLQDTKAQLFNVMQESCSLQVKADIAMDLQEQVTRLNKELLLMGELQQKYQQRLVSQASMQSPKQEMQFVLDTYKHELSAAKASLSQKIVECDALATFKSQLEDTIAVKDTTISEQKKLIDSLNGTWQAQVDAVESKYNAQQKITTALSGQILELQAKLEAMSKPAHPLMATCPDEGATRNASSQQHDGHVEEARECRETPPSDLSPNSPTKTPLGK